MSAASFRTDLDEAGILLVTWDMPDRSMNVITLEVMDELEGLLARVVEDGAIKGVVVTSGKPTFSGGADLKMLEGLLRRFHAEKARDPQGAARLLFEESRRLSLLYRRIETCGKPWVAAVNGTCMGGATELALACHARLMADDERARIALPEVKVGLFPGAGGTQRVMRMTDAQAGLQFLMQGRELRPAQAKSMRLVDAVVPAEALVAEAKALLAKGVDPVKPWDKQGFKLPGGAVYSPQGFQFWPAANAIYRRETHDNYPAARAILKACFEGLQLPMDLALKVESRYFANVLQTTEAASMIRTLFVSLQELNKGARRPAHVPARKLTRLGIIGAGFMGAGIATVSAEAGLEVVLIDRDLPSAEKGKAHVEGVLADRVAKGRLKAEARDAILARVTPTDDYAALAGCDLVIEAVFEDREVKRQAIEKAEAVLGTDAVFGSNTSTLPITSLAALSQRPQRFIGIHFFSPVEKMMLVELILGRDTGDEALALALDYVRLIRKTPIVVNDSRGFYTSRVVGTYLREGHLMLAEGVPPAMVEGAGRLAGMPVGPLALNDEVAVDLAWKILQATKKDLGEAAIDPRQEKLLHGMVVEQGRLGRKNRKGFYDYPEGKGKKRLWRDLASVAGPARPAEEFDIEELKQRLLVMQALETARIFEENCLTDVREADVGSILGFGFAPYTGGTLSYIDGMGVPAFVALCEKLAEKHGERFRPNALLKDMAARGDSFYGRFAPGVPERQAA